MKRGLTVMLAGILVLGVLLIPKAFAQSDSRQNSPAPSPSALMAQQGNLFDRMFDWHKAWVDEAEKNGQITPEQTQTLEGALRLHEGFSPE